MDWKAFDKKVDTSALAEDVKKITENGGTGTYEEVPYGVYEVAIEKLELKTSKKGDPMVVCWFKIVDGKNKNQRIFMNQVITQGFQIHIVNNFLKSLKLLDESEIEFNAYSDYNELLLDVAENAVDSGYTYELDYSQNDKGYNRYEIKQVFGI